MSRAPVLVLGYGNPGRGDDALGPMLIAELERRRPQHPEWPALDLVLEMQLQVENSLDLQGRELVLMADAAVGLVAGCGLWPVEPKRDPSYTTHELSPSALLQAYVDSLREPPPPCFVLGMRSQRFDLGAPLSLPALGGLAAGVDLVERLLATPTAAAWRALCSASEPPPHVVPVPL